MHRSRPIIEGISAPSLLSPKELTSSFRTISIPYIISDCTGRARRLVNDVKLVQSCLSIDMDTHSEDVA